jgi:hypothetical protein
MQQVVFVERDLGMFMVFLEFGEFLLVGRDQCRKLFELFIDLVEVVLDDL